MVFMSQDVPQTFSPELRRPYNITTTAHTNTSYKSDVDDYFDFTSAFSGTDPSPYFNNPTSICNTSEPIADLEFESPQKNSSPQTDKPLVGLNCLSKKIFKVSKLRKMSVRRRLKTVKTHHTDAERGYRGSSWTPAEDKLVQTLVMQLGKKWTEIAKIIGNRTGKQVRDRYNNFLRPNINTAKFTPKEDTELLKLVDKLGMKWTKISKRMPGRTEYQVKNRYYNHIKKSIALGEVSRVNVQGTSAEDLEKNDTDSIEFALNNIEEIYQMDGQSSENQEQGQRYQADAFSIGNSENMLVCQDDERKRQELQDQIHTLEDKYNQIREEIERLRRSKASKVIDSELI